MPRFKPLTAPARSPPGSGSASRSPFFPDLTSTRRRLVRRRAEGRVFHGADLALAPCSTASDVLCCTVPAVYVESNPALPSSGAEGAQFITTHWSVVLAAGRDASPQTDEALEALCRTYWNALYAFVRRQGHGVPDAQDLTQ